LLITRAKSGKDAIEHRPIQIFKIDYAVASLCLVPTLLPPASNSVSPSCLRPIDIALATTAQFRTIHRILLSFVFAKSIVMPALMSKRPSAALGEIHRELDRRRKLAVMAKGRIVKKSSALPPIPKGATGAIIQKPPTPIPRRPAGAASKKPSMPRPRAPAISYVPLEEAPKRCTAPKGRPTPFAMNVSRIQKSPAPIPHEPAGAAIKNLSLPPMAMPAAEVATKKSYAPPPPPPPRSASVQISRTTPPLLPSSADVEHIQKETTVYVRTPVGTLPTGLRLFIWLSAVVISDAEDGYLEVMYKGDFPRDDPFRTVRVAKDQVKS
jgi:hypothetical protein